MYTLLLGRNILVHDWDAYVPGKVEAYIEFTTHYTVYTHLVTTYDVSHLVVAVKSSGRASPAFPKS